MFAVLLSCIPGTGVTVRSQNASMPNEQVPVQSVGIRPPDTFSTLEGGLELHDVRWSPDGRGMALLDSEAFCRTFLVNDEDDGERQS